MTAVKKHKDIRTKILEVLEGYHLQNMCERDDEGSPYPLVDLVTPDGCTVDVGEDELFLIADAIAAELTEEEKGV